MSSRQPLLAEKSIGWLAERHLPLWRDAGRDARHGGYHERLDRDGRPLAMGYKRTMVQCRQIITHAHCAMHGVPGADIAPVWHGLAFLLERCRNPANDCWYFKVTPEGQGLDDTIDTYTLAFVLTALAYSARAMDDRGLLDRADELIAHLDRHLLMDKGGYHAVAEADWRRRPDLARQNPNMHLIEAFIALHEAEARPHYRDHALALLELCRRRLVQPSTDTLGEYFDQDWVPDPAEGYRVEPGHHFEWSWLLHRLARLLDRSDARALADRLFATADRYGVDRKRGGVYDAIDRQGGIVADTKRIWPMTEYLKALAVRVEAGGDAAAHAALDTGAGWFFDHYLLPDGRWREHLAADMSTCIDYLPGSTSYHIVLALTELMRVTSREKAA